MNEELEYLIKNGRNIEVLDIFSQSILASHNTLCSKMIKLKIISLYRGLCECNVKKGGGDFNCLCIRYKRKLIVRRPKMKMDDNELTKNGSILKHLDFYTQ